MRSDAKVLSHLTLVELEKFVLDLKARGYARRSIISEVATEFELPAHRARYWVDKHIFKAEKKHG